MFKCFTALLILLSYTLSSIASDYFQQSVEYRIDVTLDAGQRLYAGHEQIQYTNHSAQPLDTIYMHLYPNAYSSSNTPFARQQIKQGRSRFHFADTSDYGYLKVSGLQAGGQFVDHQLLKNAPDEMYFILPKALQPGDTLEIEMDFKGRFPAMFSRMGVFKKDHFAATQWYPKIVVFDQDGWHPDSYLDQGEFYGDYGRFDVSITLPKNFLIDATGLLQDNPEEMEFRKTRMEQAQSLLKLEEKKARKKAARTWANKMKDETNYSELKTVRFVAENVHDFAWFCGPQYLLLQKWQPDSVLTNVLVLPENLFNWRDVPKFVTRTLDFYGSHVGKYQYPKAAVVDGALSAGGGMEYPMITIISASDGTGWSNLLEMVVMHEVGHNWFMGMLGSDERRSAFLDEGMNSFLEYKYLEHYYGRQNLTRLAELLGGLDLFEDMGERDLWEYSYGLRLNQRLDQSLKLRAEQFTGGNYGGVNYQKSAALLLALEYEMGTDTFWAGMHHYFDAWHGRHPRVENFIAIMSDQAGRDLQPFFDQWYQTTRYNDFVLHSVKTEPAKDGFITRVGVRNKGTMQNMSTPVAVMTTAGDTLFKRWQGADLEFVTGEKPQRVEVNPDQKIFETNYLNNRTGLPPIDWNMVPQIPTFTTYQITFFPSLWYDGQNDKLRIGALMWTGNPINNHWFIIGSYNYGTTTGKHHFRYKVKNRFYLPLANYWDISAEVYDYEGLRRYSWENTAMFQARDAEYEKHKLSIAYDYVDFYDPAYALRRLQTKARYGVIALQWQYQKRRFPAKWNLQVGLEKSAQVLGGDFDYFKIQAEGNYRYRYARDGYLSGHLFYGLLGGDAIPVQEKIYAAGDLDPRQHRFAFLRSGDWAPGRRFTYNRGMNMYAYNAPAGKFYSGRAALSASVDVKIPYLPVIYGAVGTLAPEPSMLADGDTWFSEGGLKLGSNGLVLILPLYMSRPVANDKNFEFRWLLTWKLSLRVSG